MYLLNYLIWSAESTAFTIPLEFLGLPDRPVAWYGILFAMAFVISQQIMFKLYEKEGRNVKDVELLTTHMVIATILGARLGHCLFYNPVYYLTHPWDILKIWEGGLASHGGAIGILLAIWIYVNYEIKVKYFVFVPYHFNIKKQKREGQSFLWVTDRLVIAVALTGAMIRLGNFMNSEMEGIPTNSSTGVVYAKATREVLEFSDQVDEVYFEKGGKTSGTGAGYEPITAIVQFERGYDANSLDNIRFIEGRLSRGLRSYREVIEHIDFGKTDQPLNYEIERRGGIDYLKIYGVGTVRHAAQLYESAYCLLLMFLLFLIWRYKLKELPVGFNFALFMMLLWSLRFVDEFFKMNQEDFEEGILLNMGQILSIPMFLVGLGVMIYIYTKKEEA